MKHQKRTYERFRKWVTNLNEECEDLPLKVRGNEEFLLMDLMDGDEVLITSVQYHIIATWIAGYKYCYKEAVG